MAPFFVRNRTYGTLWLGYERYLLEDLSQGLSYPTIPSAVPPAVPYCTVGGMVGGTVGYRRGYGRGYGRVP